MIDLSSNDQRDNHGNEMSDCAELVNDQARATHDVQQTAFSAAPYDEPSIPCRSNVTVRLIVVLEGGHDVKFLKRISRILHADDPHLPDLSALEQKGLLLFVPIGGSNFCYWTQRLAGLGLHEVHLYDREIEPLTTERQIAAEIVNHRPGCRAFLTGKRATENYLDCRALQEARGLDIAFGDSDDVPLLVARSLPEQTGGPDWSCLPSRSRRRLKDRAKRWLNTDAVNKMTPERLAERDPKGDVRSWLTAISELLR